jgi:DNA-binding transcriptional LysR family regulator
MKSAKIPDLDWNDLRIVLAVARGGTLAAAARALHVDQTTVARRLTVVEATIGATLFVRGENARRLVTEAGEAAIEAAERVEQGVNSLITSVTRADFEVAGTVRLTAVPIIVNHLLVPALGDLAVHHPRLQLELIAEPRDLSLVKREADLAIRLARPSNDAGAAIVTRRLGVVGYGVYVSATMSDKATAMLPQGNRVKKSSTNH